ncbi:hypothetical protein VTN31DRAFT_3192 [Thermomyces dupontii]|uniref:uncharacterized protein n=1 Tax=Talaromyces thermophilus TaxID=28565 RepID=UPI00374398F1
MSRPLARSICTLRHACVARRFFCLSADIFPVPYVSRTTRGLRNGRMLNRHIHDAWRLPHGRAYSTSTSVSTENSKVVLNPRYDDDGNPLFIKISPRAASRLRQITDPSSPSSTSPLSKNSDQNPYNHLRITVTSGGCHGFQYLMSLESSSKIDPEEDTVFEATTTDGDPSAGAGAGEAKVVMDGPSLELLHGSTVDFTTELIGSQFKIVDNPRATSSCGCGTSFDVKD